MNPEASNHPKDVPVGIEPSPPAPHAARPKPPHHRISATEWHHACRVVLLSLLGLIAFTGLLLMTVYSPSVSSAWGSVWYIETQLPWGWLIRGLHRFSSDALILLTPLYLAFLLLTRLHRAPYRARWCAGLVLLFGGMAAALSGYLLPWDQHGYWGMTVRLNILARTPWIGESLRVLLTGGSDLGALSLTRFYTLHIVVLPLLISGVTMWWLRRECESAARKTEQRPAASDARAPAIGSDIAGRRLRGAILWLVVFAGVLTATCYTRWSPEAVALSAPADASTANYPARPEWFNLFLFQWLKYFEGSAREVIGSIVVPGAVLVVLALIPWIDRGWRWRVDRYFSLLFCGAVFVGTIGLTGLALREDAKPRGEIVQTAQERQQRGETLTDEQLTALRAASFHRKRERARARASRAVELANSHGIPPEGPLPLLANDPITRGPELFAAHCAGCHRFDGHNGLGEVPVEAATSSDLAGFATRTWLRGFLNDPMASKYFGLMRKPDGEPAHTRMAEWLNEMRTGMPSDEARKEFENKLDAVAAYLESESRAPGRFAEPDNADEADPVAEEPSDSDDGQSIDSDAAAASQVEPNESPLDAESIELIRKGRSYFMTTCNECHSYRGQRWGTFRAPDMYGYGSVDWIENMIRNPSDESLYRDKGREPAQMPAFEDRLTRQEQRLIAEWLHRSRNAAD